MRKQKSSIQEKRGNEHRYKTLCALMVIVLLILTPVSLGKKTENTSSTVETSCLGIWTEQQKLMASDGDNLGFFGLDISFDEEYALIGSHGDDDHGMFSGAAYIFKKTETTWVEEQKLYASDGEADDLFGSSVDLDAEYAIIGKPDTNSPGAAYIYKNTEGSWAEEQILTASDGEIWDEFGYSVALDAGYAIIGAHFDNDIGSAYIFKQEGTTWIQQAKLVPSDGEFADAFGTSVAIQADYAVVGALCHDDNTGAAYIFKRENTSWMEEAILTASDGQTDDRFGNSVAIKGNTVVVGSLHNDEFKGAAYIFNKDEGTWIEKQKLIASDCEMGKCFGASVDLDDDCIFVGAPSENDNTGSAYMFTNMGDQFIETQKLMPSDPTSMAEFGCCVSLMGTTAMIGKYAENDFTGSAYVFSTESGGDDFSITLFGGLGFTAVIYNNGTSDATNVSVSLHVEGGVLKRINKTITDTVYIPARGVAKISTGLFLGLGHVTITACANATERTVPGLQLVLFSKSYDNTTWKKSTKHKPGARLSMSNDDISQVTAVDSEKDTTVTKDLKTIYMNADCQKVIFYRPVMWLTHLGPLWFTSEYAYLAFIIDKEFTLQLDGENQIVDVPAMVIPYRFFGLGPLFWIQSITRPVDGHVTLIGWCEDVVIHPLT